MITISCKWIRLPRQMLAAAALGLGGAAMAASPEWLTANDAEIREVVAEMTIEEKIGQMTQPDLAAIKDPRDIHRLFLGSVLSGGNSDPRSGNTLKDWAALHRECQDLAARTRLKIPLLYGIDAVHGHNNVLGAVVFPHNIGLGCTGDPELIREIGEVTAAEVRATGVEWTFAPCLTVPRDIRWGRAYEGYSSDPAIVTGFAAPSVLGLQGERLQGNAVVVACAKHFVGDGGTTFGTSKVGGLLDQGDTRVDEATLRRIHLAPYPDAIKAGVATIMPSYSSWNGVKCSGSRKLLTGILKNELGFEGFLLSDYNAIDQLVDAVPGETDGNNAAGQVGTDRYKECIEISINAGMDMVMVTERYGEFITLLTELATEGRVPMSRIDDAVTRILRVKFAMGLRPGAPVEAPAPELQAAFGSEAHRAVARRAVNKSLVLLKNRAGLLPLSAHSKKIHVVGRGADDMGMQCGGWTIDWQGKTGEVTPGGDTILAALRKTAGDHLGFSADGSGAAGADVAIVVVGEEPYAEMKGDRAEPELSEEDAALVAKMKAMVGEVVVVILSGRPLVLGEVADQADALVAAWLPGSEGDGVADLLFGAVPFTGKLSFAWPRESADLPEVKEPLYAPGFGLEK